MLNLTQIHERIEECEARLEELVEEITRAAGAAAGADATYKTRFAQARLAARAEAEGRKITTDEAEDKATVATEKERADHLFAANDLTVLREALRATQARMDGLRTMAASFRGAGG